MGIAQVDCKICVMIALKFTTTVKTLFSIRFCGGNCMKKLWVYSVALLMVSLFLGAPAYAQLGSGTLSGVVKDDQGNGLPGVTVTAKNIDTGWSRLDVTAENGAFRIPSVPFGTYDVS